jgi:hypothetical protein
METTGYVSSVAGKKVLEAMSDTEAYPQPVNLAYFFGEEGRNAHLNPIMYPDSSIVEDYQDIPLKADRMKAIRQDPYFNALQVKFAYAVTCHKAQGGQWAHVYVDQGYMTDDMLTPDYIHWLYTAFTRATEMLYLVNWPKTQVEGE